MGDGTNIELGVDSSRRVTKEIWIGPKSSFDLSAVWDLGHDPHDEDLSHIKANKGYPTPDHLIGNLTQDLDIVGRKFGRASKEYSEAVGYLAKTIGHLQRKAILYNEKHNYGENDKRRVEFLRPNRIAYFDKLFKERHVDINILPSSKRETVESATVRPVSKSITND